MNERCNNCDQVTKEFMENNPLTGHSTDKEFLCELHKEKTTPGQVSS